MESKREVLLNEVCTIAKTEMLFRVISQWAIQNGIAKHALSAMLSIEYDKARNEARSG